MATERKIEIHLVRGNDAGDGRPFWAYVAIYDDQVPELQHSLQTQETDLDQYGVVLRRGYGEPDKAARDYIRPMLRRNADGSTGPS